MRSFTRRILCLLTACILLISAGCSFDVLPGILNSAPSVSDVTVYESRYRDNPLYATLDIRSRLAYGALYTALTDRMEEETVLTETADGTVTETPGLTVRLPEPLYSKEEAQTLYDAFFRDNPRFFYVHNTFSVEGYQVNDTACYDTLKLTYFLDAAERRQAMTELDKTVDSLLADLPDGDDFDKELYLHDRLTEICAYDNDAAGKYEDHPLSYTAYGALVNGSAVCEGYSRAMQLLLGKAGIPCTLLTGRSVESGEAHMWNHVCIGGEYYHLDATWDDSDGDGRHYYFNVTDEQIAATHKVAGGQADRPPCTATEDNYYRRKGLYVDTYQRQEIAGMIANAVRNGKKAVELQFAADKYDNALLFFKNATLTRQMVDAHLGDSGYSLGEYQLQGRKADRILILCLNG